MLLLSFFFLPVLVPFQADPGLDPRVRPCPAPLAFQRAVDGGWEPAVSARSGQTCWANVNLSGLYAPVPSGEEWLDWGTKSCATTGLLESLTLGYATTALDLSAGGEGARLELVLRQGTQEGGTPGEEIRRLLLEELPGAGADGLPQAALITVELDPPLCLDDGPIGWSYGGLDGLTGPLLVATESPPDPTGGPTSGTVDAFDIYLSPAADDTYMGPGSLSLEGIGSFYLELSEYDGQPLSVLSYNADGANPAALSQRSEPILATDWELFVDLAFRPGANLSTLLVGTRPFEFSTAWGTLLVAPPFLKPFDLGQGQHTVPIPKDPTLDGVQVYVQGVLIAPGGKLVLTNAFYVTLGL